MAIFKIDCDGTIWEEQWPGIGPIFPEAIDTMQKIKQLGHTIVIDTCRTGKYLEEAIQCLKDNDIPFDYVNENVPWLIEQYGDCRKISCDYDVDDKNITPWTWDDVLEIAIKTER
jgi:hydroxymethylpyrimidine pyrophosphatase-like HAD family hydrolase